MKRYISIVMAIMFLMTSLPINATVQTPTESLLSRVQSFNEENNIASIPETTTEVVEEQNVAYNDVSSSQASVSQVGSDNVLSVRNYEEEILKTTPVSEETASAKSEEMISDKNTKHNERTKKDLAIIRKELAELNSVFSEDDWYTEDFFETQINDNESDENSEEILEEENSEDVITEETDVILEDPVSDESDESQEQTEEEQILETENEDESVINEDMPMLFSDDAEEGVDTDAVQAENSLMSTFSLRASASGNGGNASASVTDPVIGTEDNAGGADVGVASHYTVSGSVDFPVVVPSGSRLSICAYRAPVIKNGRVINEEGICWERNIKLDHDKESVSFSTTLPSGNYIFSVQFLTGNKQISGNIWYYTADGSVANKYVADVIGVNGDVSNINMIVPQAESYISGTLDFSNCIPDENCYINVYAACEDSINWTSYRSYIYVPAGATSVDYEIGVAPGAYELSFNGAFFDHGYYRSGTLLSRSKYVSIISAEEGVDNLDVCIPAVGGNETDTDTDSDWSYDEYAITVNLDSAVETLSEYVIALIEKYPTGEAYVYDMFGMHLEEGDTFFSTEFYVDSDIEADLYVAYRNITGSEDYSYSISPAFLYYSEALGIVADIEEATAINGDFDIVINEPSMVSVSGSIDVESDLDLNDYVLVGAEFKDGIFCDNTNLLDASYTIKIPERYLGETFELFVGRERYGNLMEDSLIYNEEEYILRESQSIDVNAGKYTSVEGMIYLPQAAPENGINVEVETENIIGKYVILPGEDSMEYLLPVPDTSLSSNWLYASLNAFEPFNSKSYAESYNNRDFYFDETVTVSGTVSLPEGLTFDKDVNLEVNFSGKENGYAYRTVLAGQEETSYSLQYPKGVFVEQVSVYIEDEDVPVAEYSYLYENSLNEDTTFNIQLERSKTISGIITLPEDVEYEGEAFGYEIFAESTDGRRYWKEYETSTPGGENTFSINVPLNEEATYKVGVYVYGFRDSDDTCIDINSTMFYASDNAMVNDYSQAAEVTADSIVNMYFPIKKRLSGKVLFTDDAFSTGEFRADLYIRNANTGEDIRKDISGIFAPDAFEYSIYIPSRWNQITVELGIWENDGNGTAAGTDEEGDPVKTNVSLGRYTYDNTQGFIYTNVAPAFTELEGDLVLPDFTVPKATKVTGKIVLPADFKSTGTLEYIDLFFESYDSTGQNWGEAAFLDDDNNFEAYVPYYIGGEYHIAAYRPWNMGTNILEKNHYYVDDEGCFIPVNITPGEDVSGIQIEYETGYAISGTISLPADAVVSDYTIINVNINYGNSNANVRLDSKKRSGSYMLAVPRDNVDEMPVMVNVNTWTNAQGKNPESNICTGEFYLADDSTLASNYEDADIINITEDLKRDFSLASGIPVTVNIKRPANSYGYIYGNVYLEYMSDTALATDYFRNEQYFSMDDNAKNCTVTFVIPREYEGKEFYLYYYAYQGSNVYTSGNVWVNPDGSYSKTHAAALPHTIEGETSIDFTLGTQQQLARTISGTISFEEGCELTDGSCSLYVYAYNTYYGRTSEYNTYVTSIKDYDYKITLPDDYGDYRVSAHIYSGNTNICNTTLYYTSTGVTTKQNEATWVPGDSTDINLQIPKLSEVSGKIIVDEDYKCLEPLNQVNVMFRRNGDYYTRGVVVDVDEDMNYTAYLPYDYCGECMFGIRIESSFGMNNLVKGVEYWTEDWITIERGEDVENVDFAVETGYALSGKVKLPEGVTIPKNGNLSYNLSLNLGNNYAYLNFEEGKNEAEFMLGIPKDNRIAIYFNGSGSCYSNEPVNAYLGDVMYSDDGSVYYEWEDDIVFGGNSDVEDIELTIPTGVLVNFDIDAPKNKYLYGYFEIEDLEENYYQTIDFNYSNGIGRAWSVLPEYRLGDAVTIAYCCNTNDNSGYYIPWDVYMNRDGNFYGDIEDGSAYVLDGENNIEVTLPLAEDVIYPEAILQSAHPYKSNAYETYNYTYDGDADSLMVTFSENTETEYCDYIYITDGNGVETSYSGTSLSGATIAVPGNSFTIRLESDGGTEYFGFAITEVRPVVTHTVTFKNYDGTILETAIVFDGQNAEYTGLTPERAAEGITKYHFTGWDKELINITADTEFIAQFKEVIIYLESEHNYGNNLNKYYYYTYPEEADALNITFSENTETESGWDKIYIYDADGTEIEGSPYSGTQLKGKTVTVKGNSFSINFTTDGGVTFYGFEVVGIAPVKEYYTVTFKNYDGTVLSEITVPAGTTAVYDGETPVRENADYEYTFIGWDRSLTNIYSDLVVTAQYRLINYVTVSYYNYDNTLLYTDTIISGDASEYQGAVPFRPIDDNGIGYVFDGWSRSLDEVYYDTSVYAEFVRRSVKKITTEAQLRAMAEDPDGVFVLENDITLTSVWKPIDMFEGVFDGNGHSIKNITFDVESYSNMGFFNMLSEAVLRNLNLEVNINSEDRLYNVHSAPLAIDAYSSDIRNVHIKGSMDFADNDDVYAAGFVEILEYSYVDGSSANVDITTNGSVAGFASDVFATDISNSYYSGTLTTGYCESVVGFASLMSEENATSYIDSCYSNATLVVPEDADLGQIAPFALVYEDAAIDEITAVNCYYNQDTFAATSENEDLITLGTGLTDEQMKNRESFAGFDFNMIWEMGEDGYPTLSAAGGKICAEHSFTQWEQISEPTCEEDGISTRKCTRCGRVERNITPKFGHSFGTWTTVKEASVLSEGERTRQCSVCYETESEAIEKIEIDLDNPNYGLVHFNVVDAVTLAPISNAQIFISTDNDGENTFTTDESGKLTQFLPIGIVNVSLYKSGYLTRTVKIDVVSGEQNVPAIGISTRPLVEAKLSSKVMSYDEIIDAGIDVNAPGNNHVVKYNVTLTFGTEKADVVTYFNDFHTCVGNVKIPVYLSNGTTVNVYPVSEDFYLMVYGEVQWLKEMFDVEMLIINNSNTDTVTQCKAELILPNGLSLAEMVGEQQTLVQNVDDIDHSESKSVHWYVRGDVAGEYNIGANLDAVLAPFGDIIDQHYTLEEPIKVYAGNAMHMDIYVPGMTFYGDSYPIKIELTNVSDRTLYNVSNSIKYFKEGKVTHYSDGSLVSETYFDENTLASIGSSEFKPGDKISIEVQADVDFRTSLIRTGLEEIKKYVGNIDNLLNAYDAYLTGAKTVNDSYFTLRDMKDKIAYIIETKAYEAADAETAQNLLAAVTDFTELVRVCESQKAVELLDKLKTTGVYKLLTGICEKGDVFASYRANRISKFVNTITAIIKSENITPVNAVSEEMLFELLRRAIESIPVKYYLEDVLVSTLAGSTTSIPYTVHVLSAEERFSSIHRLDSYLNSVVETAIGHMDSPWLMGILSDGATTYEDAEDVIFVNGTVNKFAASDNVGDVEFKVWTSAGSSRLEITSTNESATTQDGALSFTGPGYISVKALETGSGTLYMQMGAETKEYNYTVVDAHTCTAAKAITIISPDTDAQGYMISVCDVCHSIMSVDKHESACENHVYGEYTVEMDANGDELGIKHRTCKECGHIQYLVIDESIDYMEFILTPESKLDITQKDTGDGNYLKQVVAGMTAEQITSNFDFDNVSVEVVKADGTSITATSKIGTGNKLIINSEDGTTSSELTVIVKGDTTGEGRVSVADLVEVFNHVQKKKLLSDEYLEAAYVNDDKRVSVSDLVLMFNAIHHSGVLR